MIEFTVKRTLRKKIIIRITPQGAVEVRAPYGVSMEFIEGFVSMKKQWIQDALEKVQACQADRQTFIIKEVRFLGMVYPVKNVKDEKVHFDGKRFFLPDGSEEKRKAALIQWMRSQAREIFRNRADFWAEKMGVSFQSIKISNASTRWGSCSAKGNINLCWRLVFSDGETIDYVIIHELAHLVYLEHSKQFWALVRHWMPEYQIAQQKLKQLEEMLSHEDWNLPKA